MAIELISEIVQKNGGSFPLMDTNNIRGGFYSVGTESERDSIPVVRRKTGMLCYVIELDKYFRLEEDGSWGKANLGGSGIVSVDTSSDLDNLDSPEVGQIAYIRDINQFWFLQDGGAWGVLDNIVVSDTEPSTEALWIDPTGDALINQEGNLTSIRQSIQTLQQQMDKVIKIAEYGAIAGDASTGGRTQLMDSADPINPNGEESADGEESVDEATTEPEHLTHTLPNISVKMDTLVNFGKNFNNLIDGEPVWVLDQNRLYIYINGVLVPVSDGSGGSTPTGNVTKEDIEKLYFDYLGFTNSKDEQYRMELDKSGGLVIYNTANYDGDIGDINTYGSYISDYLRINSVFLGGTDTRLDSFSACTHNYVELANGSEKDINLNGIYLLYRTPDVSDWTSLALRGIIKAGSTFLVRGDRCSYKSNMTLDVDTYDQLWYDNDGKLIRFDNGGGCFYLVCSNKGLFYKGKNTDPVELKDLSGFTPYSSDSTPTGYIDFVGIKTRNTDQTIPSEGNSPISTEVFDDPKDCIFVRSFPLDPCSQAQKMHDKKKSSTLWTYINMSTKGTDIFPYYSEKDKHLFVPKGSVLSKNIFDVRTTFKADEPNMLNITFGRQATDNGSGATRCFNWISAGYYDEGIQYKRESDSWDSATTVYSINKGDTYEDSNINTFIDIYSRIKWVSANGTAVTTHKVIIRGLAAGDYVARVIRKDDPSYIGDSVTFKVKSDSDVNSQFSFVQTTDQQAFNFYEYQAWTKAAYAINKNHPDIDFTVNTGDMTQNGNRENEWLDYYNGRKKISATVDMVTIGNNDLCGVTPYELGNGNASLYKINHRNIQYYYCFELDESNPAIFTYKHTGMLNTSLLGDVLSYDTENQTFTYYMPSVYSFNYGKYHFICLNSEFAPNTYSCYYNDSAISDLFKQHAYYNMYKWLEKDTDTTRNNIAYMHELPFCITKGDSSTGVAEARTISNGSKLNNELKDGIGRTPDSTDSVEDFAGGCNFSQFFQEHNIKLCLGGHKHTYSLSYPTKENVSTATGSRVVDYSNPAVDTTGTDGVVYAMCQATGYKLVSNKELPGSGIAWLRKWFAMLVGGTASPSQYYPMYSYFSVKDNQVDMQSYAVYNIYSEDGKKVTSFNINKQYPEFETKNSTIIEGTDITIEY